MFQQSLRPTAHSPPVTGWHGRWEDLQSILALSFPVCYQNRTAFHSVTTNTKAMVLLHEMTFTKRKHITPASRASILLTEIYSGNDYKLNIQYFKELYNILPATSFATLSSHRNTRIQNSIHQNPYFFNGMYCHAHNCPAKPRRTFYRNCNCRWCQFIHVSTSGEPLGRTPTRNPHKGSICVTLVRHWQRRRPDLDTRMGPHSR